MKALVIVDMLEDFVHGSLANPTVEEIVPHLQRLLEHAREEGWVVVFANDAHQPDDPELRVWGEHAMAGTPGAAVIGELAPEPGPLEVVVPKRAYGAFDDTDLAERLHALGVEEIVFAGQHTHICIRHSVYGAFRNRFSVAVARDAVCAFAGVDEDAALDYMRTVYGARITSTSELTGAPLRATVRPLGEGYECGDVLEHEP
jgi:nicotinamidase-related amidase